MWNFGVVIQSTPPNWWIYHPVTKNASGIESSQSFSSFLVLATIAKRGRCVSWKSFRRFLKNQNIHFFVKIGGKIKQNTSTVSFGKPSSLRHIQNHLFFMVHSHPEISIQGWKWPIFSPLDGVFWSKGLVCEVSKSAQIPTKNYASAVTNTNSCLFLRPLTFFHKLKFNYTFSSLGGGFKSFLFSSRFLKKMMKMIQFDSYFSKWVGVQPPLTSSLFPQEKDSDLT